MGDHRHVKIGKGGTSRHAGAERVLLGQSAMIGQVAMFDNSTRWPGHEKGGIIACRATTCTFSLARMAERLA